MKATSLITIGTVAATGYLLSSDYYYLAVLIGPALVAALYFVFINPALALYSLLFLIPFDAFRQISGEAARFLTVSKFLGALVLAAAVWKLINRQWQLGALRSNLWYFVGLFALTVFVSALFNGELGDGVNYLRQLFTAAITMTLVYLFFGTQKGFEQVAIVLSVAVTINGILTLIGFYFEVGWLAMGTGEDYELVRGTGGSRNPNLFASQTIFVMPFFVYWLMTGRNLGIRFASLVGLTVGVLAVVSTLSRAGTVVMVMTLVILGALYFRRLLPKQLGLAVVLGLGLTLIGAITVPSVYWERINSLFLAVDGESDRSLSRRASYLYVGRDNFVESPIIGHGPLSFPDLYAKSQYAGLFVDGTKEGGGYRRRAHNTYLETVVEMGVTGLFAFLAILLIGMRNFSLSINAFAKINNWRLADLARAYQVALFTQMLYFFFSSQPFSKLTWAALGISVIALRLADRSVAEYVKEQQFEGGQRNECVRSAAR